MARSDEIPERLLAKTHSGKLKWKDNRASIGENTVTLSVDEWDRPELIVKTPDITRVFRGESVNELYVEVDRLAVMDDSDFMTDLDDL